VDYHRNNWWKAGYEPINDIARWPGNGDISLGQAAQLAPYKDYDQDGIYNPMNGDFPLIRGDQSVFFIYNDDREHTEMLGNSIKAEIHGMVYGFNESNDSALWNTVFVHYDIYNRSENTYHDFYTGIFTDLDLGYPWDDYLGSDVNRSSYYVYNGEDFDPDSPDFEYPFYGYGEFPPAQSVTILAGPYLEPDGIDNQPSGCDYGVNGINFGNGITDDERMGLCGFYYFNAVYFYDLWPYLPGDCHNLMQGIWKDGFHCYYGGRGHMFFDPTSVGPACYRT
jgi:hypothetical protein